MGTVILKWNPSFSSISMLDYLSIIQQFNKGRLLKLDWSVWDYDKINVGDRYFLLKLGYGATGVVSAGIITSQPFLDQDWSGKKRDIYYVFFEPEVLINPDVLPILTNQELSEAIPDFEWHKGHSGLVLDKPYSAQAEELWQRYLAKNSELLQKAKSNRHLDQAYLNLNYEY